MVTSDTIVGIVGAVVLTGAMIVVFVYEKDQVAGDGDVVGTGNTLYEVTWQRAQMTVNANDMATLSDDEKMATFGVPAYAWHVHYRLTWTDEDAGTCPPPPLPQQCVGGPDSFETSVTDATGAEAGATSGSASPLELAMAIEGNDARPANTTARGNSQAEAMAAMNAHLANLTTPGQGDWEWLVKLTGTGAPNPAQADDGEDFTISITIDFWKPVVAEA